MESYNMGAERDPKNRVSRKPGGPAVTGNKLRALFCLCLALAVSACAERLPENPDVKLGWIIKGWNPAWSPSSRFVMYSQAEMFYKVERLWLTPLIGGEALRLTSIGEIGIERNGCWLPNMERDDYLYIFESVASCEIRAGSVDDDKTNFLFGTNSRLERASGSADGSVVVFSRADSAGLWRLDPPKRKAELIENEAGWFNPRYPCVGPDGRMVHYVDTDEEGIDNLYRIDTSGGEPTRLTSLTDGAIRGLTVSADHTLAAFIRVESGPVVNVSLVFRTSLENPSDVEPMEIGTYHAPQSITISPVGRYLAFDSLDDYIRIVPFSGGSGP